MKLIRFNASILPFHPMEKQVIYFDASPISKKMGYEIVRFIDNHYDEICKLFTDRGLEFCFLPRISRTLQIPELLTYFRPDLPPEETFFRLYDVNADNLAKYFANGEDIYNLPAGLIKYTGQQFGNDYIFSFIPLNDNLPNLLIEDIEYYLRFYTDSFHSYHTPTPSVAENVDDMLSQAQQLVLRLRNQGVNDMVIEEIFHPTQKLSRLHIKYARIFLTDYQNMEITMPPLSKAVFLLYLRHPEGIRFSELSDFRDELSKIYTSFSGREDKKGIDASIDDLTNPLNNSINEKCSRIRRAFLQKFEDRLARNYYITGGRGEVRKILLPRELVTWTW